MLGDFSNERPDLAAIGRDFGWSVARTSDQSGLRDIAQSCTVVAVLIQAGTPGIHWQKSLRAIRAAAPRARIIICHKADQVRHQTEMLDAGAFGVLLSPLAHSEVRQALGFVWASRIPPLRGVSSTAA